MSDFRFPRAVWVLSIVSLLADVASEMLYPVMPVYLQHIGFSIALIGVLEGFAEALAGLSKGYFGALSDARGQRLPFVRLGYFLSACAKPLLVAWTSVAWVFSARLLDRLGKGLRTGARDALLSAAATPETKGRVFGLHRGMDTLGAVLGPVFALVYLHFRPEDYRTLFFIAFFPGLMSVGVTYLIKEKPAAPTQVRKKVPGFASYWRQSLPGYRAVTGALLVFALVNSSDALLLLRMKAEGLSDESLILVYIGFNLVYALFSLPLGHLADRWQPRRVIQLGLLLFAIVYAGFALGGNVWWFGGLFFLYGIYMAATEGVSKAWISNLCTKEEAGAGIGVFSGLQSIANMLASATAGLLWAWGGASLPFAIAAGVALAVAAYFAFFAVKNNTPA
ncbi:MAG: MFS transporter [Lewinellaceae bacterium]|nr:MFS transporter [Lewinellaceae bacterium]